MKIIYNEAQKEKDMEKYKKELEHIQESKMILCMSKLSRYEIIGRKGVW